MSIWDRILGNRDVDRSVSAYQQDVAHDRKASLLAFVDIEYSLRDKKIHDIGALKYGDAMFHETSKDKLLEFLNGIDYLCGHNIVNHDAKHLLVTKSISGCWSTRCTCRLCCFLNIPIISWSKTTN